MEKKQLYAAGQPILPHSQYDKDEDELLRKSDIAAWAKEEKKPSYSAAEVGADDAGSADNALVSAKTYADNTYMQATGYTDQAIADLIGGAPKTLDTLKEIADAIEKNENVVEALDAAIGSKASEKEFQSHESNAAIHITESERKKINNVFEEIKDLNDSLGGNHLLYNEGEDAYYIQHGADAVPKKLGSGGGLSETNNDILMSFQAFSNNGYMLNNEYFDFLNNSNNASTYKVNKKCKVKLYLYAFRTGGTGGYAKVFKNDVRIMEQGYSPTSNNIEIDVEVGDEIKHETYSSVPSAHFCASYMKATLVN